MYYDSSPVLVFEDCEVFLVVWLLYLLFIIALVLFVIIIAVHFSEDLC